MSFHADMSTIFLRCFVQVSSAVCIVHFVQKGGKRNVCANLFGRLTCFTMLCRSLFSFSRRLCSRSIASLSSNAFW